MSTDRERKREEAIEQMKDQERLQREELFSTPAVHPRYRFAYESIYQEQKEPRSGTLGLRIFISILLFAGFLALDERELPSFLPEQTAVLRQIQSPFSFPSGKQFDLMHIL